MPYLISFLIIYVNRQRILDTECEIDLINLDSIGHTEHYHIQILNIERSIYGTGILVIEILVLISPMENKITEIERRGIRFRHIDQSKCLLKDTD